MILLTLIQLIYVKAKKAITNIVPSNEKKIKSMAI